MVVLGCSFAALEFLYRTARRRGRFAPGECIVVEPAPLHTYLPLAHEGIAKNTYDAAAFCAAIGAEWCAHAAAAVDPIARTVTLDNGEQLSFSRLVVAVGSVAAHDGTFQAKSFHGCLDANRALTIVGGGITGVEWSAELAHQTRVTLITDSAEVLPTFAPGIRRHAARRLAKLGVEVRTNQRVTDSSGATTLWADGVRANPVLRQFGLPLTDDGHLIVDSRLAVPGFEDIYGIGDAVRPSGDRAIDAIWQGAYLARRLAGAEPRGYRAGRKFFYGISLGRGHSMILRGRWWADTPLFVAVRRWIRATYYARFTLLGRWRKLEHALNRRDHLARRARLR